jgi:hypothetical protein
MTAYDQALADLDRQRERVIALKPTFDFAETIVAECPELFSTVSGGSANGVWMNTFAKSLREVQPLLAAIVRGGYHPQGRHDYTDGAQPRCTYDFSTRRDGCGNRIIVNVNLSSGEGGCRFEQVGEKTVPILKIVCDGGGEP